MEKDLRDWRLLGSAVVGICERVDDDDDEDAVPFNVEEEVWTDLGSSEPGAAAAALLVVVSGTIASFKGNMESA